MNASFSALSRLTSIDEVAAAFVFNEQCEIIARELPDHYSDASLSQIAADMVQLAQTSLSLKVNPKEIRITFENFTLWIRCFGKQAGHFLAVFVQNDANIPILRQPINLAALNLEKAVTRTEEQRQKEASSSSIAMAAQQAEKELLQTTGEDSNGFFEKLHLVTMFSLGPAAYEILLHGCRKLQLTLPVRTKEEMEGLVRFCADQISNTVQREIYVEHADELIQRVLLEEAKREN